ncbi:MAG TPA: hypothetical protein VKI61_13155, partial [Chitinophagaceae bacterium]|nr:hypothetical protein [Chitinophagaceae bacterium]
IVNWTLSNNHIRIDFTITAAELPGQEDIEKGFTDIVNNNPDALTQRQPEILFTYLKGKSVQMQFLFWCKDVAKMDEAKNEVSRQVYDLLQQKGINIL